MSDTSRIMPYCAFYAVPIDHAGNSSTWGKYGMSEMTVWVEKSTGKIKTIVGSNGYIVSSYPIYR